MSRPPRIYPADLSKQFAADPFSDKMHNDGPQREHTPLGLLVEILHWYETNKADCGPAFQPIANSVRQLLEQECPKELKALQPKSD